jgi:hypothetical protein
VIVFVVILILTSLPSCILGFLTWHALLCFHSSHVSVFII